MLARQRDSPVGSFTGLMLLQFEPCSTCWTVRSVGAITYSIGLSGGPYPNTEFFQAAEWHYSQPAATL